MFTVPDIFPTGRSGNGKRNILWGWPNILWKRNGWFIEMVQADVIVGEISIFQREKCLAMLDSWENPLAARASLTLPSCFPNYPCASWIVWTHARYCPFLNFTTLNNTNKQAEYSKHSTPQCTLQNHTTVTLLHDALLHVNHNTTPYATA